LASSTIDWVVAVNVGGAWGGFRGFGGVIVTVDSGRVTLTSEEGNGSNTGGLDIWIWPRREYNRDGTEMRNCGARMGTRARARKKMAARRSRLEMEYTLKALEYQFNDTYCS
jgi:hypothetical protein